MIELDGSSGEGGGQMVRTALSLSALTGRAFRISNIRAGRSEPGLRPQHLAGVRLMQNICSAQVSGDQIGSLNLEFRPGPLSGGTFRSDVGTAGSLTLLLQAVLPALVLSPVETELDLVGGTDVRWSPPIDHYQQVLFPLLRRMGAQVQMDVRSRGFHPRGGGHIHLKVHGGAISALRLIERGELQQLFGTSYVQNLPADVADRMVKGTRHELPGADIVQEVTTGRCPGAGLAIAAEYQHTVLGWNVLGEKGVPAERVGREAAQGLLDEMSSGSTLDLRTADQLLPFLAMAHGDSIFTVRAISGHLEAQMDLVPRFLPVTFLVGKDKPITVQVLNRT